MLRGLSNSAGTNRSGAKRKHAIIENIIEHLESDKEMDKTGSEGDRSLVIEDGGGRTMERK